MHKSTDLQIIIKSAHRLLFSLGTLFFALLASCKSQLNVSLASKEKLNPPLSLEDISASRVGSSLQLSWDPAKKKPLNKRFYIASDERCMIKIQPLDDLQSGQIILEIPVNNYFLCAEEKKDESFVVTTETGLKIEEAVSVKLPSSPASVIFSDTNPLNRKITGFLVITPPEDRDGIEAFEIYWGQGTSLRLMPRIASVAMSSGTSTTQSISEDIPSLATHLLIYSKTTEGLLSSPFTLVFSDLLDATPPVPGSMGAMVLNNITASSMDIAWEASTDNASTTSNLQYRVYRSTLNNISSVATAEANGIAITPYVSGALSTTATNLLPLTTYYFNVIVRDEAGNKSVYASTSNATTADITAPTPGSAGLLTTSAVTGTTLTVNWSIAADNVSTAANLQYILYQSSTNNISSVADAELNGTAIGVYTNNISSRSVSGLSPSTTYYFNVVVRDESLNKSAYSVLTQFTTADITAPTPGASGTITSANIATTSLDLNWTLASDDITSSANIEYLVYRSLANNLSNVAAVEANGVAIGVYTANIATLNITGLTPSTTYYFNIVARDQVGNKSSYTSISRTTAADTTSPTAGNSGTITTDNVGSTSIDLIWTAASDDVNTAAQLEYRVYRSTSNNISSIANILANGTAVGDFTANITTLSVTGLSPSTTYYFNIIVRDSAGNQAAYAVVSQASAADTTSPIAGNSGTLNASNISATSLEITWTAATDNATVAASLEYLVYLSTTNNIGNAADAAANGTAIGVFTANITTRAVTGLTPSTTYYFNVIVRDAASNSVAYTSFSQATAADSVAPTPGNTGTLASANVTATGLDVNWTAATDNATAQIDLEYLLYRSGSNNISTVALAESNGTAIGSYSANIITRSVSGLVPSSTYYFNLIVRDQAGNKASYTSFSQATSADSTAPTPGNSGTLTSGNTTTTTIDINWTAATDNATAAASLEYLVYYSTSNNMTTVSDTENNGTAVGSFAANITTRNVTGLNPSTLYYFNVIVRDGAGNKSVYTSRSDTTSTPIAPTITFADRPRICDTGASLSMANSIGTGTLADPHVLCNSNQIVDLAANHCSSASPCTNKHFLLMKDINMNGVSMDPIYLGSDSVIDGNYFKISNLSMSGAAEYLGFIGSMDTNSTLRNVSFENISVNNTSVVDGISGVVGFAESADILNVHVTGTTSSISSRVHVGGLLGHGSNSTINVCSVNVSVSSSSGTSTNAGGIVGFARNTNIKNCQATGTITNNTTTGRTGGIVGYVFEASTLNSVLSEMEINPIASGSHNLGGAVGFAFGDLQVLQSVIASTLPTLAGRGGVLGVFNDGGGMYTFSAANSYFDTDKSGITDTLGGNGATYNATGLTTAGMLIRTNFVSPFAFGSSWYMDDPNDLPRLIAVPGGCAAAVSHESLSVNFNTHGSGAIDDPYIICTAQQLHNIGANASGCGSGGTAACNANFVLGRDLDMSVIAGSHNMIGTAGTAFSGTFDGQRKTIQGLTLSGTQYVGLFRQVTGTAPLGFKLRNLGLSLVNITGTDQVGALVGYYYPTQASYIKDVYSSGTITTNVGVVDQGQTGGLIGRFTGSAANYLSNAYSDAAITMNLSTVNGAYLGGLVGFSSTANHVRQSYYNGAINLSGGFNGTYIGGLMGRANSNSVRESYAKGSISIGSSAVAFDLGGITGLDSNGTYADVYSRITITATASSQRIGGILGGVDTATDLDRVYVAGAISGTTHRGAISGQNYTSLDVTDINFWDNTILSGFVSVYGATDPFAGIGSLTTGEMQAEMDFNTWEFFSTWKSASSQYHKLGWEP